MRILISRWISIGLILCYSSLSLKILLLKFFENYEFNEQRRNDIYIYIYIYISKSLKHVSDFEMITLWRLLTFSSCNWFIIQLYLELQYLYSPKNVRKNSSKLWTNQFSIYVKKKRGEKKLIKLTRLCSLCKMVVDSRQYCDKASNRTRSGTERFNGKR